ncbi:MAG: lipocalin family protein [Chitinophagaceae bacterium]|nr:lipocalin family protein [Chitinophagaceae bacterium]MBK8951197.1 lipocalin family protein [Chitinophagaceae bacterium]
MKKQITRFPIYLTLLFLLAAGCKKDSEEEPPTKTDLITGAGWKFDKATAGIYGDVSAYVDACYKDNIITFASNLTGNINEATIVCSPSTAGSFTWSFSNNETTLNASSSFFAAGTGSFNIVTLNETNLVLSQNITLPAPFSVTVLAEFTLKH